jgi:hypothetical protein
MTVPDRRKFASRFVRDGRSRAQAAAEPEIRAQVLAEYSKQFEATSLWGRFGLRRTMEREVRLRLSKVAPPDALYGSSSGRPVQ